MSDKIDRILKVLDVGIQTSTEHSYGTDHDPSMCSRCQHHEPAPEGDLCSGCRSYLLGDSAESPSFPYPEQHPPPSEGLPCVGGPLDGRLVARDGSWLEAVIPSTESYRRAALDPMAPTVETVRYSRRLVVWLSSTGEARMAWCWLLEGLDRQIAVELFEGLLNAAPAEVFSGTHLTGIDHEDRQS